MDSHTLTMLAFCSLAGFLFWYQHKIWQEQCNLSRDLGSAQGELRALKNQEIRYLTGRKRRFFRSIDVHLYLESHDGKLTHVIGATNDLSSFPELTAEDIAAIRKFLATGMTVASTLAAATHGTPVLH